MTSYKRSTIRCRNILYCLGPWFFILAIPFQLHAQCNCDPLPLPNEDERVVYVGAMAGLEAAIDAASGSTTIYLNSGIYQVSSSRLVNIGKPGITLRSASGNRNDVIIEGEGMDASGLGHGIYINADNVTIADLTVRNVQNHGIFVNPGADSCLIHNVRITDCGEQLFKASGYPDLPPKNDGIIECSTFEYTTTLDDGDDGWYTNGIDLLNSHNWIIRDNVIRNIKHNPQLTHQLAGPAILVWGGSSGTIVERNRILECDFGISFGNAGQDIVSHSGGIIRNNFVLGYEESDFGIGLIRAPGALVVHNTVYSPGGWPYSIEARFTESTPGYISNNFTDEPILPNRDGAKYYMMTNLYNATASDFVDASSGDLHLVSKHVPAVNAGSSAPDRTADIDCEPVSGGPDIGADEYSATTGFADIPDATEDIGLFPNPANGSCIIQSQGPMLVEIFDITGLLVSQQRSVRTTLHFDARQLRSGTYFLKVSTSKGNVFKRLIVHH